MTELDGWDNFYVIIGSSAGALIGLQFVVATLLADAPADRIDPQAGQAFGTPNVVHFAVALLVSALVVVPWHGIAALAILCGLTGVGGVGYVAVTARRMRTQKAYQAVLEDWLFHALLPWLAYLTMAAAAAVAFVHARAALFALGGATLLLLFVGIHNAWDTVSYHVFVASKKWRKDES